MAKTLDDVSLDIIDYPPIDPKISKLVKAINYFGIDTTASCQGHLHRGHPFPWVVIWPAYHQHSDPQRLDNLKKIDLSQELNSYRKEFIRQEIEAIEKGMNLYRIIQEYNSNNTIKWDIDGTWLRPNIKAKEDQELALLQQDADNLAEYIFEEVNRINEPANCN